jgi:threonine aldolase
MSKGLGAPIGSLLIGSTSMIQEARRIRKVMGGGMRQTGILAAACTFALEHNIQRLKIDNDRAKHIGELLATCPLVDFVKPVYTNIVIFKLQDTVSDTEVLDRLAKVGIMASAFGDNTIRLVFHLDITDQDMLFIQEQLPKVLK